ncbi:MAG: restriction endonuclease [Paludibacter sp.]|nr:restriction endonuclease [Paludibacter sp.]
MNWKEYEEEIFESFKSAYPDADIKFDQRIQGRYSREERQIDILVEGRIAGRKIRIVVDGKYYNKNIDVKHVETFISMVEDLEADQGILVTSKGYSKAAINRAYYGPLKIELDILSFDELKNFQGFGGITYSGRNGAILPAPFGWIIDGKRTKFAIATLYQRGTTLEKAQKAGEWIYMSICNYDEKIKNIDDLIKFQEEQTKYFHPTATFNYEKSVTRNDGHTTILRKILRKETELYEYTGFVDFNKFSVFCVLFTPEELREKNVRKLEYVIENLKPVDVNLESVAATEISTRENWLKHAKSGQEKAEILISIGQIHRDMKDFDKAKQIYLQSIEIFPKNYGARLALLEMDYISENRDFLIEDFFELEPSARQIQDDLVRLAIEHNSIDYIEAFFIEKIKKYYDSTLIVGSVYFSLGDLFYNLDLDSKSYTYFKESKKRLVICYKNDHPALKKLDIVLAELSDKLNIKN